MIHPTLLSEAERLKDYQFDCPAMLDAPSIGFVQQTKLPLMCLQSYSIGNLKVTDQSWKLQIFVRTVHVGEESWYSYAEYTRFIDLYRKCS